MQYKRFYRGQKVFESMNRRIRCIRLSKTICGMDEWDPCLKASLFVRRSVSDIHRALHVVAFHQFTDGERLRLFGVVIAEMALKQLIRDRRQIGLDITALAIADNEKTQPLLL